MNSILFFELVKPKQSFFGLSWLVSSLFLLPAWPTVATLLLFIAAFFLLRFGGMLFNGLFDFSFDRKNSRTANRPLPRGSVKVKTVLAMSLLAMVFFFLLSLQFGYTAILLAFLTVGIVTGYSLMKRVSQYSHFVLGFVYFLIPQGVSFASQGTFTLPFLILGVAAALCVASNDILYAIQDIDFDKCEGLHSIPATVGPKRAQQIAYFMHFLMGITLIALGLYCHFGFMYYAILLFGVVIEVFAARACELDALFAFLNLAQGSLVMSAIGSEMVWRL